MHFAKAVTLFVILFASKTFATNSAFPAITEGQLLIRLTSEINKSSVEKSPGVESVELLFPELQIYLVKLVGQVMSARASLRNFQKLNGVVWAQLDHEVTPRVDQPSDPDFEKQWNLDNEKNSDVNAMEAWQITTGGSDANGNEIVVAVVDGGVDVEHEDLNANIWNNKYEINNNGIDDDENGFIDDIFGWNAFTNSPQVVADDHATHVAGIIGAVGNNEHMVTGLNWNVKIMTVDRIGSTSVVVKAYAYILANKKLWQQTKGAKGANVVSTNSSFGVDFANCKMGSYPAWNDMYNELGQYGILSAAATANRNLNVDTEGDVPTGCDSPYIISVTNTTNNDKKNEGAAYGKVHVDLGAPGTDIWSTLTKNKLGYSSGTSMATPLVAGGVALMHAGASKEFADFYLSNPAQAALKIKEIMLMTVDKIPDLKDRSVSEGRLNIGRAVQMASEFRQNLNN